MANLVFRKKIYMLREKIPKRSDSGEWRVVRFMTDSSNRCTGDSQL